MIKIKNLRLDWEQRRSLSDVSVAGAQLSAGSIFIPFVLQGLDPTRMPMIVLGLILTAVFCLFSIIIVKKRGRK